MCSKNNETFPNKFKDILDIRPSCKQYEANKKEPYLCDGILCITFSPLIGVVWSICCIGVTCKKINKKCCNKIQTIQTTQTDTTTINTQPQQQTANKPIAPKEILLNPRLK